MKLYIGLYIVFLWSSYLHFANLYQNDYQNNEIRYDENKENRDID